MYLDSADEKLASICVGSCISHADNTRSKMCHYSIKQNKKKEKE